MKNLGNPQRVCAPMFSFLLHRFRFLFPHRFHILFRYRFRVLRRSPPHPLNPHVMLVSQNYSWKLRLYSLKMGFCSFMNLMQRYRAQTLGITSIFQNFKFLSKIDLKIVFWFKKMDFSKMILRSPEDVSLRI